MKKQTILTLLIIGAVMLVLANAALLMGGYTKGNPAVMIIAAAGLAVIGILLVVLCIVRIRIRKHN